jgi:predicted Zn-dependent protease with MMP-like domain
MEREAFEAVVARTINDLPLEFRERLENVDIVVQDWPTPEQLRQVKLRHPGQLLGLYHGIPRARWGRGYRTVLPDKISIFQKPIEAQCHSAEEIELKIGEVVRHEIAHHFGTDEKTLQRIERERRQSK